MKRHAKHVCTFIAAAVLAVAVPACAPGHGRHTQEFRENAERRMTQMKAATTWDMAQQQFLAGDLEKALRSVDESLTLQEGVAKSHVLRGRILVEMGRLEMALHAFDRAVAIDPNCTDAFYYRGIVLERFGRYPEAFESYSLAANLDPTNPQHTVAAAEMLMQSGRLDEARTMLESKSGDFSLNAGVKQTLGHIAFMQGDTQKAQRLFREAALLAPDEPAILEDLARAQMANEDFREAEQSLRRLLDMPENAARRDLMHLRADCLRELDRPVDARTILLQLISLGDSGTTDVSAWIKLGLISALLEEPGRLREAGSRVVALAPDRFEGYYLLALWNRTRGDMKAALSNLEKSCERLSNVSDCADAVADRSLALEPLLLRAVVLDELGRRDEARTQLVDVLAHAPDEERAARLLAEWSKPGSALAEVNTEQ